MTPGPASGARTFDLLAVPVIGTLLRRRGTRLAARLLLLALAVAMILHGWLGSQLAPKNLATLLTWVHYRGLLVLVLLVAGNAFCYACPIVLFRDGVRRFVRPVLRWPHRLRTKWPAIALFVGVLFAYELFDLWGDPFLTAWLVAGYFIAAAVVDGLFRDASFCKYLCPVGQFNFVSSTVSPLEVAVLDPTTCATCPGKECIRGTEASPQRPAQRGCELQLFQPRKAGNLDCTFCLDCAYACPYDNVGVQVRVPGAEIDDPRHRSGVGRPLQRPDFAFLSAVFVFGALLNAFGMVSPVYALEQWLSATLGIRSEAPILGLIFLAVLVAEPLLLVGAAAWASRRLGGIAQSLPRLAMRHVQALVPLGFGIWLSHYAFHFLTGLLTFVPVVQSLAAPHLGAPNWRLGGLSPESVLPIEMGFLALGLAVSLGVAWRMACADAPSRPVRAFVPWALLHALLLATAVWLLTQPMEMRGTFLQ